MLGPDLEFAGMQSERLLTSSRSKKGGALHQARVPIAFFHRLSQPEAARLKETPIHGIIRTRYASSLYFLLLVICQSPGDGTVRRGTTIPQGWYATELNSMTLAGCLGFNPDLGLHGTRVVNDTLRRLEAARLISLEAIDGSSVIRLLDPFAGDAPQDYKSPTTHYVTLDGTFFAFGWHVALEAAAREVLLVALYLDRRKNGTYNYGKGSNTDWSAFLESDRKFFWLNEKQTKKEFGISDSTRTRGWKDLEDKGVVRKRKSRVHANVDPLRTRNTYQMNFSVLRTPAWEVEETPNSSAGVKSKN